jgi:molybdopterin/thiamine biosynthesis adenylyltransferase
MLDRGAGAPKPLWRPQGSPKGGNRVTAQPRAPGSHPAVTLESKREDRFERASRIAWIDLPKVAQARVLVVGAGALGNEVCKDLALSGFRRFTLVDMDRVVFSNLNRCLFFTEEDARGKELKVNAVRRGMLALVPGLEIETHADRVENVPEGTFAEHDLVLGCVDNAAARIHVNGHAYFRRRPYIDGATLGMIGKVQVVLPPTTPCIQCTMNKTHMAEVAKRYSCSGGGMTFVEAPVAAEVTTTAVVAAVQAREAVKVASGRAAAALSHLWYYDGLRGTAEVLKVEPNPGCPVHVPGAEG